MAVMVAQLMPFVKNQGKLNKHKEDPFAQESIGDVYKSFAGIQEYQTTEARADFIFVSYELYGTTYHTYS